MAKTTETHQEKEVVVDGVDKSFFSEGPLTKCKVCKGEFAGYFEKCPHCGAVLYNNFS